MLIHVSGECLFDLQKKLQTGEMRSDDPELIFLHFKNLCYSENKEFQFPILNDDWPDWDFIVDISTNEVWIYYGDILLRYFDLKTGIAMAYFEEPIDMLTPPTQIHLLEMVKELAKRFYEWNKQ